MKEKLLQSRREFLNRVGGGLSVLKWMHLAFPYTLFLNDDAFGQNALKKNLLTFSFPNGCDPKWWNYQNALQPLAPLRQSITVLQQISNPASTEQDAHEQGGVTLFTGGSFVDGQEVLGTAESIDQIAGRTLNANTLLNESIVAGVARGFAGGEQRRTSWYRRSWKKSSDNKIRPVSPIMDPNKLFTKLTNDPLAAQNTFLAQKNKSVLDELLVHYKAISSDRTNLSDLAKRQLKEHFEHLRAIEKRVEQTNQINQQLKQCRNSIPNPNFANIPDKPEYSQFEQIFDLQVNMVLLAFKCGLSHTGSLMFGSAGEEYFNPRVNPKYKCHQSSHWPKDGSPLAIELQAAFVEFRKFYMTKVAAMIQQMKNTPLAGGNLYDQSILVVGTEFGESNEHIRNPQPLLVAGGGGIKTGKVIAAGRSSNDVYHSVLKALNINVDSVGRSDIQSSPIDALV